jgi:hypothetical protein
MMKNRTFLVSQMVLNLLLVLSLVFLSSIGCQVSQSDAEDVLGDEGFHDVVVEDWAPFSCSDDDTFKSHFRAERNVVNADGTVTVREVHGTICCGWWKDCTVRH